MKKHIKCYWYPDNNLGDCLPPILLKKFDYNVEYCAPDTANLFFIGSILEKIPENYKGVILGSGFINKTPAKSIPNAKILAVRGKNSKSQIQPVVDTFFGDPGLLAPLLVNKITSEKFRLGIIPHYVDQNVMVVEKLREKFKKSIKVINVRNNPIEIINEIASCNYIISSSLHGLVIADSFSIPNRWVKFSDNVYGNDFKFHDYYSSFETESVPYCPTGNEEMETLIQMTNKPGEKLLSVQVGLVKLMKDLRQIL